MSSLIEYFRANADTIMTWFRWHAWLSIAPVLLGLLIALPLGWLADRYRLAYPPMITIAGLVYTIPSLALFVLLPAVLGTKILDPVNVIVALTLYTVALLVRVIADGLASVPSHVQQAASAMGLNSWQRLLRVQLPLAVPVIVAGLRVATVSNVSLVSVSALLGVPQLGQLFTDGFQLSITQPIVLGVLGCILLAVVFDLMIILAGRWLTPWQRAVRGS